MHWLLSIAPLILADVVVVVVLVDVLVDVLCSCLLPVVVRKTYLIRGRRPSPCQGLRQSSRTSRDKRQAYSTREGNE